MTDSEIVLASIGPVQGFIVNARRCQDLWFGSWLLSELSRTLAHTLKRVEGTTLVFPGDLRDDAAVANKVLAVVPVGAGPELARRAGDAMNERLEDLAGDLFDLYAHRLSDSSYFERESAMQQVRELIEYQWVVVPVQSGYGKARADAEKLLAMRKQTRDWPQINPKDEGKGIPKSSIDGSRESVLREELYEDVSPAQRRSQYLVKKSERLSGVDLLKRVGLELDHDDATDWRKQLPKVFHSTSHVAALPLLTRIARRGEMATQGFATYLRTLEDLGLDLSRFRVRAGDSAQTKTLAPPYGEGESVTVDRTFRQERDARGIDRGVDGVLLFESRLADAFEQASIHEGEEARGKVKAAQKALRSFLNTLDYHGDSSAYAYYALLLADGDRMGAALEAMAEDEDALEQHQKLSSQLDNFAKSARNLVEEHGGSPIYTGGDDVMALLPLHTALACAEALRSSFAEKVGARVPSSVKERPTLSVGLAIAHHLDPMREARELAKEAERAAKDAGRNALAIAVKKRSGGTRIVRGKWSDAPNLATRINGWAELLSRGDIPHAVGFELEQAARPFEMANEEERRAGASVVAALAKRALGRRRAHDETLAPEIRADIERRVSSDDPVESTSAMADELHIARVFERAYRVAWGTEEAK